MDYSKSGSAKFGKGTPRHVEDAERDAAKVAKTKAELLARMKAAADKAARAKKQA